METGIVPDIFGTTIILVTKKYNTVFASEIFEAKLTPACREQSH